MYLYLFYNPTTLIYTRLHGPITALTGVILPLPSSPLDEDVFGKADAGLL